MDKKKFTPILIQKLSKPIIAVSKHFDTNFEYVTNGETQWYDHLDCATLTKKFGSPLFVVSEKEILYKIKKFRELFQFPGFHTVIAYSFKTNYLPGVCNVFLKEKCWAEIVSGMEYQLAKTLKVKGPEIIFNGPYKTESELIEAVNDQCLIHLDHWDELKLLQKVVAKIKKKAKVGIRFNFPYYNHYWDKFGFFYDENAITVLLKTIRDDPYLEFMSIHNHCGTYIMEPDLYTASVYYIEKIFEISLSLGLKPTMIDIGGGFPSKTQLRSQFTAGYLTQSVDLSSYVDAIREGLARIRKRAKEDLLLIFEPGRALIDEAEVLICTVIANKKSVYDADITVIDAGVNILPTTYWYHREPKVIGGSDKNYKKRRLCGPLCMQIDVINDGAYIADVEPGTHMIIPHVGAYNQTQSMQFIQYRPATILMKQNLSPVVIRRKETFDDIFIRDNFSK